jgi:hypothetical protein
VVLASFAACGPSQGELDATTTVVAQNIYSTQTAQAPTATNTPTDTPIPTLTATVTATPTLSPTVPPSATPTVEPGSYITSTLENGWIYYESQIDGFALELPPEWIPINLNPNALENSLAISAERNPAIGKLLNSKTLISLGAAGMKFYALELSQETIILGLPASLNFLAVDLGFEMPLNVLTPLTIGQLENLADPDYPITDEPISLSNTEAVKITYATEIAGINGDEVSALIIQYIMVDGTLQYVLSFGAPRELADSYSVIFEEIAKSFTLIDK